MQASNRGVIVDARLSTERARPLDWDTSWEPNGRHVVSVRAYGAGRTALAPVVVRTRNAPPEPPVVDFVVPETVTGLVPIEPLLSGGPAPRVELWVDGVVVQTATSEPWSLSWDAAAAAPGRIPWRCARSGRAAARRLTSPS